MSIMNLSPGAMVQALRDLDAEGAKVGKWELGVVFQAADFSVEPNMGPLVRWVLTCSDTCYRGCKYHSCIELEDAALGGVCNVYDGDVMEVKSE